MVDDWNWPFGDDQERPLACTAYDPLVCGFCTG